MNVLVVVLALLFLLIVGCLFVVRRPANRSLVLVGALVVLAIAVAVLLDTRSERPYSAPTAGPDATSAAPLPATTEVSPISPVSPPLAQDTPPPTPVASDAGEAAERSSIVLVGDAAPGLVPDCLLFTQHYAASGSSQIRLLENGVAAPFEDADGLDPAWSRDGSQIAFASSRESGTGYQVFLMNSDGSDQRRLGKVLPGDNRHPTWSPGGDQIVFQSTGNHSGSGAEVANDLLIAGVATGNATVLAGDPSDDREPVWSSGTNRLAFISNRTGVDEVYTMTSEGHEVEMLTADGKPKSGLRWSDNDRFLVYSSEDTIYALDARSGDLTPFVTLTDVQVSTPELVQEKNLLFLSADLSQESLIYVFQVTQNGDLDLFSIAGTEGGSQPRWSTCR